MVKRRSVKRIGGAVVAVVLIGAVVPLLVSCGDDEEPTGPTPGTFNYPHADGSQWIYKHQGNNFVKYVISGTFEHPYAGNAQRLLRYTFVDGKWQEYDAQYLKVSDADVKLYEYKSTNDFYVLLKFPLKVGNQWDAGQRYTAKVASKETISVPAGSFDCYKIDYIHDIGYRMTFWWPSKVGGMGAKNFALWAIEGESVTIELASYNLPT